MKIKLGARAAWRPLFETYQSTSGTGEPVLLGGWEAMPTGSDRKVMVALDEAEARRLYALLHRRFAPKEAVDPA